MNTGTRVLIAKILTASLVSGFIIYRNPPENNRRVFRWRNFFLLLGLTYLWLYLTLLFHELGHAFTAYFLGCRVIKISLGFGPTLVKFSQVGGLKFELVWRLLPLGGYTRHTRAQCGISEVIILASGVILEFLFAYLTYRWIKSRVERKKHPSLGQVWMLSYLIKAIFWISLICNCVPFVIPTSDYTKIFKKITKILLGWN